MLDWPIEPLDITDIFLDDKNIRSPISEVAQSALIQDLFVNEDAFEIAKSISKYGMFPDEFTIVTKEDGKYTMIEGNRRLAALKAFREPDIVPSFKDRLKSLYDRNIDRIRVVIAPNREEAIQFTANRHTIILRRAWKPLRQAFFYQSQMMNGKSIGQLMLEFPEHDIPKFIKMLEMYKLAKSLPLDDDVKDIITDERKFPITNLERMYNDTYVKSYLKFFFNDEGKFIGNTNWEAFSLPYKKIVTDVAKGEIDSRKTNTDTQRKEYIDKLPTDINPSSKGPGSFTTDDVKGEIIETKTDKKNDPKPKTRNPKKGKIIGLIPVYITFGLHNAVLEAVFNELSTIDVEKYPNATHDLLRSFLEGSLITYLKSINELPKNSQNTSYNPTLDEMLSFIASGKCTKITDSTLRQAVDHLKTKYTKNYSLVRMNMINHNEHWISSGKEVRDAWAQLEGLMKILLNSNT